MSKDNVEVLAVSSAMAAQRAICAGCLALSKIVKIDEQSREGPCSKCAYAGRGLDCPGNRGAWKAYQNVIRVADKALSR